MNGSATPRPILGPFHTLTAPTRPHRLISTGHRHLPNGVGNGLVENGIRGHINHSPSSDEGEA